MASLKQTYRKARELAPFYSGASAVLSNDGRLLACAHLDEVKIVDAASGAAIQTLAGDSEPVTALALSPDGRLVFAASRSLQLRCWPVEGGAPLRSYRGHRAPVAHLAADATGALLASGSADRSVRVWDVDGGYCTHAFTGHSGVVLRVAFHPRQLTLISGSDDGEVRLWDLVTKSCVAVLKGHFSAVTCLSIAPDGWTLLSGGRDSVAIAWNLRTHAKAATIPVYEPLEGLACVPAKAPLPGAAAAAAAAASAGKKPPLCFVTGGERGVLRVWRADTGACLYEQPRAAAAAAAAAGGVVELQLLPGGEGVMTATQDCRILFHRPTGGGEGLEVARQLIGNSDEVTDLRFVTLDAPPPPPAKDAVGGAKKGKKAKAAAAAAAAAAPPAPSSSGLPTHLVVSTNSEQIRVFDAASLSCTASLSGHSDIVLALDALQLPPAPAGAGAASGAGGAAATLLASGGKDNAVRVWALGAGGAGRCVAVGSGHVGMVGAVAFGQRKGKLLVSGGADKLLKVWDLGPLAAALASPDAVSPQQDAVGGGGAAPRKPAKLRAVAAVAAHDKDINAVAIWRLPDLVLSLTLKGHRRGVWACAFSPVDQAVATASGDRTVRLWALTDGACLRTFEGHQASVLRLSFLSAGTQLATSGADGLLKLWNIRTSECVNTFDAHEDKVWALAGGGADQQLLASGGGDGAVAVWEDCTVADADAAAQEREASLLKEQELSNALQVDDLRQSLEYIREWNTNSKHCFAAQSMLRALLRQRTPQDLLAVPGVGPLLEGLVPYTQRHYARADRLLRSTYICDYILGALNVLQPEGGEEAAEAEAWAGAQASDRAADAVAGVPEPVAAADEQRQELQQEQRRRAGIAEALQGGGRWEDGPLANGHPALGDTSSDSDMEEGGAAATPSSSGDEGGDGGDKDGEQEQDEGAGAGSADSSSDEEAGMASSSSGDDDTQTLGAAAAARMDAALAKYGSVFKRGQKSELFGDGDKLLDEEEQLEIKLRDMHSVWALPRSGKDLAAAIWRPELQLAEVVISRGKLFTHIGVLHGTKLYLHIEEAVYLVDRANLLLLLDQGAYEKRLLSTQECHDLMVGSGVPMAHYLIYCKLMRAGYVVQRHPARFVVPAGEDIRDMWAARGGAPLDTPQQQEGGQEQEAARQQQQQQQQQQQAPAVDVLDAPARQPPAKRRRLESAAAEQQQAAGAKKQGQEQGQEGWFPSLTGGRGWLSFVTPEFAASLPRVEVVPGTVGEVRATYPQMLPLQALPTEELVPAPDGGHCLLHYDVFVATNRFSRKRHGKPAFMVAIHPCSGPPSLEAVAAAELAAGETPVRHSTIEMGDICFYTFPQVSLAEIWK
eukprot:scaffold16.g1.t1